MADENTVEETAEVEVSVTEPTEEATTEQTENTEQTEPTEEEPKGTDWKAEARKWENRSKENKSQVDFLTTRVTEFESRATEAEKKVQEFESELTTMKLSVARYKAAMKYGLSADDIEFLNGKTEKDVDAFAKKLSERLGAGGSTRLNIRTQGAEQTNERPLTLQERLAQSIRQSIQESQD